MTGVPQVTTVDVPEVEPLTLEPGRTLALREDSVAFADNSAALFDPAAATRSLTELADQIGGRKVRLVGTTASYGTEAGRLRLSHERAEAVKTLGFMSEVAAVLSETEAFVHLRAPIRRLAGLDIPIPYAPQLERAAVPQVDDIVAAARTLVQEW